MARAVPLSLLVAFVVIASFAPACGDETLYLDAASSAGAPGTAPSASGGNGPASPGGDAPECFEDCKQEHCASCEPNQIACAPYDDDCTPCARDFECTERHACDPLSGTCQWACNDNDDCPDWRPLCDEGRGVCVDCFRDSHCDSYDQCTFGFCVDCARQCG